MKVTKYPQSCLVVEDDGRRLLIDPGSLVPAEFSADDLLPVDGILITHEHDDHADPQLLADLTATASVPVVANASAKKLLGDVVTEVVEDGQEFELVGFSVTARELPHVDMPNGSPGPQNTGYVIDGNFFHPGDGIKIDDLKVDKAAVPIAGPDVSPRDAFDFIKQIGAKTVVPIHYDYFIADPKQLAGIAANITPDVKFVVLPNAESAVI
jgi:L-ascorbate metabolism protein UlaG (beta-lactamase superfamily)